MKNEKKKLPIGIENFEEIQSAGFYYIDKSYLIKGLMENWAKVTLFSRPRRFGKSLNMSMLKKFFDINGNLYAGKAHDVKGETVKYRLRYNVVKDDDLKYQLANDVKLKVKAICYYKDGTKIEGEIGEEGGLSYYSIYSLFKDRQGIVWVGTYAGDRKSVV